MLFGKKKRVLIRIGTQVQFRVARDPETGEWIGACDLLGITTSGEMWDDLWQNAADAIQLLMTDLFEEGDLEAFLRSKGWQVQGALPPPQTVTPRFELPYTFGAPTTTEELLQTTA